ncbi:SCO family protein [Desulfovibrio mangrovi]|uniref:SCO family protein n=1 Tax=Desulfovibrio mangrovi TaxID=2976983 RepID=UPI0022451005|nr:SCO family protein [Desulfovibrio mangrovi]UZP68225.1 SCO family protein [Desulfovibrio mangrovi]
MRSLLAILCLIASLVWSSSLPAASHDMSTGHATHEQGMNAESGMQKHDTETHGQHGDAQMVPDGTAPGLDGHVHKAPEASSPLAFVDEKLGQTIPQGIMFKDETGQMIDVRTLMDKPTIIAPVYFTCPSVCHVLQGSIARVLPQMNLKPGEEYRVLSVSFDETDPPALAARRKANYMAAMHNNFPPEGWRFLTGDKAAIDAFMGALGYHFTRMENDFVHPVVIVIASPEGKVVRYLYGNSFLPFDTTMALTEAAEGKVGLSLKRIVSYCFAYDPQGKRYVLDVMRIAGFVVLFGVVVLFLVLTRGGRKARR